MLLENVGLYFFINILLSCLAILESNISKSSAPCDLTLPNKSLILHKIPFNEKNKLNTLINFQQKYNQELNGSIKLSFKPILLFITSINHKIFKQYIKNDTQTYSDYLLGDIQNQLINLLKRNELNYQDVLKYISNGSEEPVNKNISNMGLREDAETFVRLKRMINEAPNFGIKPRNVILNNSSPSPTSYNYSVESIRLSNSYFPINLIAVRPIKYAVPLLGYVGPILVCFTLITNTLIVIILLHKHMRTPTNTVLACMALSDMLTGLFPLPWMIHFYMKGNYAYPVNEFWCRYYYYGVVHIPTIFHTASIWLITSLAVQRYLYVCYSNVAKNWCTVPKVLISFGFIYLIATLYNLPRFFEYQLQQITLDWDRQTLDWGLKHRLNNVAHNGITTNASNQGDIRKNDTFATAMQYNNFTTVYFGVEEYLRPGLYLAKDIPWPEFKNSSNQKLINVNVNLLDTVGISSLNETTMARNKVHNFRNSLLPQSNFQRHCSYRVNDWLKPWENIFYNLYFWFRVVFVHVVPCTTLVVLNGLLIHAMKNAMERRKRLLAKNTLGKLSSQQQQIKQDGIDNRLINLAKKDLVNEEDQTGILLSPPKVDTKNVMGNHQPSNCETAVETIKLSKKPKGNKNEERKIRDTHATTYMLVLVVSVFLIVEIPLGVMFILHIIENTFELPLIDYKFALGLMTIIDSFILASYPVNFFIYCLMSKQFRDTFKRFFTNTVLRPVSKVPCCGHILNRFAGESFGHIYSRGVSDNKPSTTIPHSNSRMFCKNYQKIFFDNTRSKSSFRSPRFLNFKDRSGNSITQPSHKHYKNVNHNPKLSKDNTH